MSHLTVIMGFLILLSFQAFSETHSSPPSGQQVRPVASTDIQEDNPPLFQEETGDLSESERKEVEGLSHEIRKAAKTPPERGNNLGEFLSWDRRAHSVQQLQKKLSDKLQNENLKSDAEIAKTELEVLLEICTQRKNNGFWKWMRPW